MTKDELISIFDESQDAYLSNKKKDYIKSNSQFFTPKTIAKKMLDTINIKPFLAYHTIKILEPSAGCGILILYSVLYLVENININIKHIYIEAYETNILLSLILTNNLNILKNYINNHFRITVTVRVINANFILKNANRWKDKEPLHPFNLIISNPPFNKITRNSPEAFALKEIVYGQPNIYTLFIALSLKMLAVNGVYAVISPRSYLVGDYSKKLRAFIFNHYCLTNIHTFDNRNIFRDVNQEIIISTYKKSTNSSNIRISHNGQFSLETTLDDIVYDKNKLSILLPKSQEDLKTLNQLSSFDNTLEDLGLKVSVGPVVQFRNKGLLSKETYSLSYAPFLISKDIQEYNKIDYFYRKNTRKTHNKSISINSRQLIKNSNYLLLRKITAKDDNNTIIAAVLEKSFFDHEFLGLDNNLLYFHKIDKTKMLSEEECYGLYCFINSNQFRNLYSLITGTHTINVSDFANIKFPGINQIRQIGKAIIRYNKFDRKTCTDIIINLYKGK